jgi:hypothetical protein
VWHTEEQQGKARSSTCERMMPTNSTGNSSILDEVERIFCLTLVLARVEKKLTV